MAVEIFPEILAVISRVKYYRTKRPEPHSPEYLKDLRTNGALGGIKSWRSPKLNCIAPGLSQTGQRMRRNDEHRSRSSRVDSPVEQ
jgi:hypothetical protein